MELGAKPIHKRVTMSSTASLVLIQTPYFNDYGPIRKAAGTYFPLGLGYISSYVRAHGHKVLFLDPNIQPLTQKDIVTFVQSATPLLVGISFMTPQFYAAKTLAASLKLGCPDIPVVLGGAHPSVLPKRTLEEIPEADFVVYGEGEQTILELLDAVATGKPKYEQIAGLVWRKDSVIVNEPRTPIADLDSLPFPDRSLIDQNLYRHQSFLSYFKRPRTIHTSRGCPGRCVYCASGHKLRSRIRMRSIDNVISELRDIQEKIGMDYLLIKDDMFTLSERRTREFCNAVKREFPGLRWHCMVRVDKVSEALLNEMKEAGLNDVFFGIESGNDSILNKAGKNITTSQIRQAVEATDRLKIKSYGAFILGLPGDNRETIQQTIDFACSLPLTMAGFSILIPYPGTKCFEEYFPQQEGMVIDYTSFIASSGVHFVKEYTGLNGMVVQELPEWITKAQRRFYLRPKQILRMLRGTTFRQIRGYARGAEALLERAIFLRTK